jgi:hypothetical protein
LYPTEFDLPLRGVEFDLEVAVASCSVPRKGKRVALVQHFALVDSAVQILGKGVDHEEVVAVIVGIDS